MNDSEKSIDDEDSGSRRQLLRLAAAAVAGGAVAGLLTSEEAAATTGNMQYGSTNNAGASQTSLNSSNEFVFSVIGDHPDGYGVFVDTQKAATAVDATVNNADAGSIAVRATIGGTVGYPLLAQGGDAQLRFERYLEEGFVTKVAHAGGEFHANITGLYYCVTNGGDADTAWLTLASQNSAGALYPISPTRVYDSRVSLPSGPLLSGDFRTVGVSVSVAPVVADIVRKGARAIAYNLTVTSTVGGFGFLAVNEGGNTSDATSAINWTAAGQTLANASVVKLNDNREITVVCGGPGASTHFIIDVVGYYH